MRDRQDWPVHQTCAPDAPIPGRHLWGIETDSGESYFLDVANDEYSTLRDILGEIHVPTPVALPEEVTYQ